MNKMNTSFGKRLLALLLTAVMVLGLVPVVATPQAKAETADGAAAATDDVATQTAELLEELTPLFNDLVIPRTQHVNYNLIESGGYYFMVAASSYIQNGAGCAIDYNQEPSRALMRLTKNSYDSSVAQSNWLHLYSVPVTISNWQITGINGSLQNLDQAVQIFNYTGTVSYSNQYDSNNKYKGWDAYIAAEYNHATGTYVPSYYGNFGKRVYIAKQPARTDPVYQIKSMNPKRTGDPWLSCYPGSGQLYYSTSPYPFFFVTSLTEQDKVFTERVQACKIYKVNEEGHGPYTYWLGCDTAQNNWMTGATIYQMVREDRNSSNTDLNKWAYASSWNFYRISELTLELFQALYHVKSYVTGGNSDGKYPAETYLGFLQYAQDAITQYNTYRTENNNNKSDPLRIELDSMARDLRAYSERLDLEAVPTSYFDIPLEVLDFRADGLLFENYSNQTPYTLRQNSPATVGGVSRPGDPRTGDNDEGYLAELIEPQLVNGRIVYREETVNYIAAALKAKYHTFADTTISFTADNMDPYYNAEFMNRVTGNTLPEKILTDGDFDSTLAKTTTPGINGGILAYEQVDTYHDLAYYMLSNLWHETPADDVVETVTKDGVTYNLPYNMKIDEIDTLRLIKDSNGEYLFDSDLKNGRNLDEGLIYTYNDQTANDGRQPYLNAASNLGFESDAYFGNNSTGSTTSEPSNATIFGAHNYGLVYHIDSAFVYYEDKNLYFEFSGDDDVYFFINNQLVCDIGGMHSPVERKISLNGDIAKDLGLKDGDICSFDMYLAERRSVGLNMKFKTNIQLLSASAITEKVQYEYTGAGVIGEELREGVVVRDNTEVGYGLKLLNLSQHGVSELSFKDDNLGVELTKDAVELGTAANAADLIFLYSTYDTVTGALCTNAPTNVDYDTFCQTLAAAIDDLSTVMPLAEGVYQLSGLTADQIQDLMELGLPASVQLTVYGFHRTVHLSVGEYTNVVYTTCRPISEKNEDGTYTYGTTITGAAQRTLYVDALDAVAAQPLNIVLDYGKPVKFDMDDILDCLTYDPLEISTLSFLGIHANAVHGNISLRAPGNLRLTDEKDKLKTSGGTYARMGDSFRFTPNGIMQGVDSVCAAFYIKDIYSAEYYLMVGINMVPATSVYYEAETLLDDGALSFTEFVDGTVSDEITVKTDTEDTELPSITNYDPTYDQNVIFIGFDYSEEDKTRYENNQIYGGTNFDWANKWNAEANQLLSGYRDNGIYTVKFRGTGASQTWIQFWSTWDFKYVPSADDWIEVRMRLDTVTANNGVGISFCPELYSDKDNKSLRTRPSKSIILSEVGNDYFVLQFPVVTAGWPYTFQYTDMQLLRCMSMTFEGVKPQTDFQVSFDYFYLGPKETCPSNLNSDSLYFGFDNDYADRYRYFNKNYGGESNFDIASSWQYSAGALTVADSAMTVTANTSGETWVEAQNLEFPVTRAQCAQVKLKFSNMTATTDAPVVRLSLALDDGTSPQHEWPVTAEQLADSEFITLTANISDLLSEYDAEHIREVQLTVNNAAGGTVTVDYIYVGPNFEQSRDSYIAAPESTPRLLPERESYTPTYDDRVLFFGFENSALDQTRYACTTENGNSNGNQNYGKTNFDVLANWYMTNYSSTLSDKSVSNGALNFSVAPDNAWACFSTGATDSTYPLNYTPNKDDWFEIRMSISGASGTATGIDVELWNTAKKRTKCVHSFGGAKGGTGYFVTSFQLATAPVNSGQTDLAYTALGTLARLVVLPTGLAKKTKVNISVDYIYIGPKEYRPSEQKQDYLYFGFENDEAAQYKYTNETYGANYDEANWDYNVNRSSEPKVSNGVMTATILSLGDAWFQTARGGLAGTHVMSYYPNTAPSNPQEIQVRVRFNDLQTKNDSPQIYVSFYDASNHTDATARKVCLPIQTTDVSTNGEWFTYHAEVGDVLSGLNKADSLRITFTNIYSSSGTGTVEIDYIYVGPSLQKTPTAILNGNLDPYGYDPIYTEDSKYSDHKTIFAEGKGVLLTKYKMDENNAYVLDEDGKKIMVIDYDRVSAYTEAKFTFTGTGFDIISRTGPEQGALRVVVCAPNGDVKKTASVINKGADELYQIPVVSVEGLAYGTYTVHIFVNAPYDFDDSSNNNAFNGALDRGGEFYFDAVRIYNPISTADAYKVYQSHGEHDPTFKELRDILIDASKNITDATIEGVVYLENGKTTSSIAKYTEEGPNNEVYLTSGHSIAFKLEVTGEIPASIDIGAKSADGSQVSMVSRAGASVPENLPTDNSTLIATATALYYPLSIDLLQWQTDANDANKHYVYVTILNCGESGILSISDIKYAYGASVQTLGSKSVRFLVEPAMIEELSNMCNHMWNEGIVTLPTCIESGCTTYTCSTCGEVYVAAETAPIGHSYTYTNNGEGHTLGCENCDDSATEVHNYVDGICICGAVEVVEPKYEYNEKLSMSMSITVSAEMQVSYTILNARIKDYESFYVEIVKEVADGESITTVYSLDANNLTDMLNPNTGAHVGYYAIYTGIKASQMGDGFSATLYAVTEDGTIYYGPENTGSIKSFLYEKIANEASLPELKTLAVDMLNYGAAAQVYFGYDAENLVNAELTEEQKAFGTQEIPAAVDTSTSTGDGGAIIPNVTLESKVVLYVNCRYEATENSNLLVVIKDMDGNVIDEVIPKILTAKICQAAYSNVGAKQMRQPIQIEMYDNGTLVTQTLTWSIESYVAQTRASTSASEALLNAVNAMLTYGDSAAAYLTATGQ